MNGRKERNEKSTLNDFLTTEAAATTTTTNRNPYRTYDINNYSEHGYSNNINVDAYQLPQRYQNDGTSSIIILYTRTGSRKGNRL
jgi:hypothetical protein